MQNIKIYQIFYDYLTKKSIQPGFIPLDNSENLRPDWFEFWPMLNFFRKNEIKEDTWYGFLSPNFTLKTGFNSDTVLKIIKSNGHLGDVMLFSPGWDSLSYFLNPFEQGEVWHPGITDFTQKFIDKTNLKISIENIVSDTTSAGFCNYIIAKKEYWLEWFYIAEMFFQYIESDPELNLNTTYGSPSEVAPLKTFIQERFPSLILAPGKYRVINLDQSQNTPLFNRLFNDDAATRRLLICCDLMKKNYRINFDQRYLDMYWAVRKQVKLNDFY